MFTYTITPNETKTMTTQTWESNGYTLTVLTLEEKAPRITVSNPMDAPNIFMRDFGGKDKTIVVNWSALGNTDPAQAGEYAAKIATAAQVAQGFQQIVDMM